MATTPIDRAFDAHNPPQQELIEDCVKEARSAAYRGKILCGAGIVDGEDVRIAVKLGVDGVLVSSSVVKAMNWDGKITELALALQASRNP